MPRKIELVITESVSDLKNLLRTHKNVRNAERINALLLIKSGKCIYYSQIGERLNRGRDTIRYWMRSYAQGGLKDLLNMKSGGNAKQYMTKQAHDGLEKRLCDPKGYFTSYVELHQWVRENYIPEAEYAAVYKYVRTHFKTKLKTPRKSHIKKDEAMVESFKKTA